MTLRFPPAAGVAVLAGLLVALPAAPGTAQVPGQPRTIQQPIDPDPNDGIDVLARGPVHEGYASTVEPPAPTPVIAKVPPDPIEELPPDQKPEGDNVQWIPGYWHWDDDRADFIWVSGFWRVPPPNRVWVPGSWREARGGWQWVHGFWQEMRPTQPVQPEIEYLPQPPAPIEAGPAIPAPAADSLYIPGCWTWRGRYVWRPGFWVGHRPGWVWVAAHYRWTPAGCVFVDGYWDLPLAARGCLFAPVCFTRPIYVQPAFVYTPCYVVSEPCMVGALFVRRGWGCYYFGDYFEPRYATAGFTAWCGSVGRGGGFAVGVGVGVGRGWHYDPLWSYYSCSNRATPAWSAGIAEVYVGRFNGTVARPPRTLVQQNTVINNITQVNNVTNVTNNLTVVNNNVTVNNTNVTSVAMVAPLKVAPQLQPQTKFTPISAEVRKDEAKAAREIRDVAVQRTKLETAAAAQPPRPAITNPGQPAPAVQPVTVKLDASKTAVARAQVKDEKKAPPPPPDVKPVPLGQPGNAAGNTPPKIDPKPQPLVVPPKVDPKVEPKGDNKPPVPVNNPPAIQPKVDLKPPAVTPKVDPKPPANVPAPVNNAPPVNTPPKVDLKPPVPVNNTPPVVMPKVDPKPQVPGSVNPVPVNNNLPKVDPKPQPPVVPPANNTPPKVDPKPVPPVVQPPVQPLQQPKLPGPPAPVNLPKPDVKPPVPTIPQPLPPIPQPVPPIPQPLPPIPVPVAKPPMVPPPGPPAPAPIVNPPPGVPPGGFTPPRPGGPTVPQVPAVGVPPLGKMPLVKPGDKKPPEKKGENKPGEPSK